MSEGWRGLLKLSYNLADLNALKSYSLNEGSPLCGRGRLGSDHHRLGLLLAALHHARLL